MEANAYYDSLLLLNIVRTGAIVIVAYQILQCDAEHVLPIKIKILSSSYKSGVYTALH